MTLSKEALELVIKNSKEKYELLCEQEKSTSELLEKIKEERLEAHMLLKASEIQLKQLQGGNTAAKYKLAKIRSEASQSSETKTTIHRPISRKKYCDSCGERYSWDNVENCSDCHTTYCYSLWVFPSCLTLFSQNQVQFAFNLL